MTAAEDRPRSRVYSLAAFRATQFRHGSLGRLSDNAEYLTPGRVGQVPPRLDNDRQGHVVGDPRGFRLWDVFGERRLCIVASAFGRIACVTAFDSPWGCFSPVLPGFFRAIIFRKTLFGKD